MGEKYNDVIFIEALKNGARLNADVARACGCSENAAKKRLDSLVTAGKVKVQNLARSNKRIYILAN
jgi:hypothetical protein